MCGGAGVGVDVVAALFLTFVFVDVSVVVAAYVFAIALVYEKKRQTNAEWYSLFSVQREEGNESALQTQQRSLRVPQLEDARVQHQG